MKIGNAPIGTKIQFGEYDNIDLIWHKVSEDNVFMSQGIPVPFIFDAPEMDNKSRERRSHGNNFYPHSNIHQWLNSAKKDWFHMAHPADEMPYIDMAKPSFLSGFCQAELAAMAEHDIPVAVPLGSRKEFGRVFHFNAKVWLPAASELIESNEELPSVEGAFNPFMKLLFESMTPAWMTRMTRTAIKDGSHIVLVNRSIGVMKEVCNNSSPIMPMIELKPELEISDITDTEGVHFISECVRTLDDNDMKFLFETPVAV